MIIEALASGCVGTTAMLTIHNMCGGMIDRFGTIYHLPPTTCSTPSLYTSLSRRRVLTSEPTSPPR